MYKKIVKQEPWSASSWASDIAFQTCTDSAYIFPTTSQKNGGMLRQRDDLSISRTLSTPWLKKKKNTHIHVHVHHLHAHDVQCIIQDFSLLASAGQIKFLPYCTYTVAYRGRPGLKHHVRGRRGRRAAWGRRLEAWHVIF